MTVATGKKPKTAPKTVARKKKSELAGHWIPDYCTKQELAMIFNMALRNVSDLANTGVLVQASKKGVFKTLPSIHAYITKIREVAAGRSAEIKNPLTDERLRAAQVEREISEIKLANMKGEMLSAGEVTENWATFATLMKTKVLSIPSKARSRMPHLTAYDQEALRDIVTEILNDLADEVEGSVIAGERTDLIA